jgi:hypothetical protein
LSHGDALARPIGRVERALNCFERVKKGEKRHDRVEVKPGSIQGALAAVVTQEV